MPVTATDTDTFPATLQRPSNGELADSASLAQFVDPLTKRTRYAYNRSLPGNFDASRAPYNVSGTGTVDDYPAVAAAVADAVAAGGGTVWLPPGKSYRFDSELVLDGRVALRTMKGYAGSQETRLLRNHGGRLIKISTAIGVSGNTPTLIEGFKCRDLAANSQAMIDVSRGSLLLERCWLEGLNGLTGGPLILVEAGEGYNCLVRNCTIAPDTGYPGITHNIGWLDVQGCKLLYPSTYAHPMIIVSSISTFDPALATIRGNDFNAKAISSGAATGVSLSGDYWTANVHGNHFRSPSSAFVSMGWSAGAGGAQRRLVAGKNTFEGATRYAAGGAPLTAGSTLELGNGQHTVSGDCIIPDGEDSVTLFFTTGIGDVKLPKAMFFGQPLDLTIYNLVGGGFPFGFTLSNCGFKSTLPTIANNTGVSARFMAADPTLTGTLVWVQVSPWATIAP